MNHAGMWIDRRAYYFDALPLRINGHDNALGPYFYVSTHSSPQHWGKPNFYRKTVSVAGMIIIISYLKFLHFSMKILAHCVLLRCSLVSTLTKIQCTLQVWVLLLLSILAVHALVHVINSFQQRSQFHSRQEVPNAKVVNNVGLYTVGVLLSQGGRNFIIMPHFQSTIYTQIRIIFF